MHAIRQNVMCEARDKAEETADEVQIRIAVDSVLYDVLAKADKMLKI
jgi:hypothetical protein